ncbi:MAG: PQQ-like beta-propeller repeat protein [Methanomassiliicoccales archaeon]|nr:MAG: PQQ-like beta-propeller repeat protein [Methanomassiliicoccales archaeon]
MSKERTAVVTVLVVASLLLIAFPPVLAQEEGIWSPPWSMSSGDARNSGVSPFIMEQMPEDVIWEMELGFTPSQDMALGPEGNIYLVHDSKVEAFDHNGQHLWAYEATIEIGSHLAIDKEGVIYFFLEEDGLPVSLVSIDAEGVMLNEVPLTLHDGVSDINIVEVSTPVVLPSGGVCFTSVVPANEEGTMFHGMINIVRMNATTYEMSSTSPTVTRPLSDMTARDPVVTGDGSIIFPSGNGVFKVDDELGQVWSFLLPGYLSIEEELITGIFLDEMGNCYITSDDGLLSINDGGALRWSLDDPEIKAMRVAAVSSYGILFDDPAATPGQNTLIMVSTGGERLWSYSISAETHPGDCTVMTADGMTIVCSNDAIVAVGSDGMELWRSEVLRPDDESVVRTFYDPVLGSNGTLYVIAMESGNSTFYAVGNWLEEAVYNLVLLFSLIFAPFFIIAGCYLYFREERE